MCESERAALNNRLMLGYDCLGDVDSLHTYPAASSGVGMYGVMSFLGHRWKTRYFIYIVKASIFSRSCR